MTEGTHGTKCNMGMRNDDEDKGGFSERLPPMTHEFLHPGTGPNRTEKTAECANSATGRMNPHGCEEYMARIRQSDKP